MPIQPGTRLGAYEVEDLIGQGAMGTVYRAHHSGLARDAAVKVLQAIAPDPDASARFQREAQAIAKMRHPNVLQVFDFGEFEGTPYMIVEYMPGGSLADRMKHGDQIDRERALRLLKGLAAALDYAHARGIVHRDVKPANVLVDQEGDPVLADFGLAKLLQQASVKTVSGVTTGTPAYMAPEQVMGAAIGPPADVYALTTMAYEFMTGAIPFEGEGMLELLYAHVHREPPAPSTKNPALSPEVDAVLLRGLAKDPASRWQSCGEMVVALTAAVKGDPVEATAKAPTLVPAAQPVPVAETSVLPSAPVAATSATAAAGGAVLAQPPVVRRDRRRLLIAGAAGALVVILLVALLGTLALLNRPQPALALDASSVDQGGSVTATVTGLRPGEKVTYSINGTLLQETGTADTSGKVVTGLRIPARVPAGTDQLKACVGNACSTASITVLRAPATPPPSSAPSPTPAKQAPEITIPASAKIGTALAVHGTGFAAGRAFVVLTQGTEAMSLGNADVSTSGVFDWSGLIPTNFKAGAATVKACNAPAPGTNCIEKPITLTA